jgi:hypothetical protein
LFHRSTPLIMRTWARCLRHHSQRRWRRPRSIYPHRVPYVSSASASTDLRLANRPLMRGCISAYVCFCGMRTGSSLASVALTLPAAEEANGLGASASTARRGAACADARAGWPSGRRLHSKSQSAAASARRVLAQPDPSVAEVRAISAARHLGQAWEEFFFFEPEMPGADAIG